MQRMSDTRWKPSVTVAAVVEQEPALATMFGDDEGPAALAWLTSCRAVLDRYFTLEDPTRLEPAERELYVETLLDSRLLLRGFVDRIDVSPTGLIRVVDYKTGRVPDDDGSGPLGPTRMRLSKPVIAAVSGHAVAGGLELALWCDLRVADDTAVFGVYCRRWGVPLIDGGTVRLPRLIGQSRAMDLILTGRAVDADEAFAIGLANRRVATGDALAAAKALALELSAFPQACLRSDRQSALDQWSLSEADALGHEFQLTAPELARVRTLHAGYKPQCEAMCARIAEKKRVIVKDAPAEEAK